MSVREEVDVSADVPLFGEPEPTPRPGKTTGGYLEWLNDATFDGWSFWALAGSCERKTTPSTEWVFVTRGGVIREALIDLDGLQVIRWVTR